MSQKALVNVIVFGLPTNIQDKIKKEKVKNTEQLFEELSRMDNTKPVSTTKEFVKSNGSSSKEFNRKKKIKPSSQKKKPCSICSERTKLARFHPEESCWFKELKVNAILESDDESNLIDGNNSFDQKN